MVRSWPITKQEAHEMEKHDLLVLNELTESGSNLRPSIQVEHALTKHHLWQKSLLRRSLRSEARLPVLLKQWQLRQQKDFIAVCSPKE